MSAAELIFSNANIVTADEVIHGTLAVRGGRIAAFDHGGTALPGAIDCGGDYLMPGLVELHTDNLEKHVIPRPKVRWHAGAAVLAHDAQMAAAGITTVFDAISCGDILEGSARLENLEAMIGAVVKAQNHEHLRADHYLHLRCEVSSPNIIKLFKAFHELPMVRIVSLMDHTPGQRQFVSEEKYYTYYMGKYGFSQVEMKDFTAKVKALAAQYSEPHRAELAAISHERGFILASHDDATTDHVEEAAALGIVFSEFPTTFEAARAAEDRGMKILMGAPNLVRGGSHSGNVSAAALAEAGCLDILSSDYVPVSLLHSALMLTREPLGFSLPQAVATVSSTPAAVVGMHDRGAIAETLRADLIRVRDTGDAPVVRGVWREGTRVS